MRNINLVLEFVRHPSKRSFHPSDPLAMMICRPVCCAVLSCTRVQGLIWWIVEKFQFSLLSFIFLCYSNFAPVLPTPPSSHFTQKHKKRPWSFSFPLKLSPFSPLQNHHHLWRFSRVWSFYVRLWLKITLVFPKKWCFVEFKRCFGFVIFRLIWIMSHSWVSFCLSLFKT